MTTGPTCSCCDSAFDGVPPSIHFPVPAYWDEEAAAHPDSELASDMCVIRGEHYFVRAMIRLPVVGTHPAFEWGVWVSLSEANVQRTVDLWETAGREIEPPMFGWLSNDLPGYEPSTIELKTMVHTQPVGQRPLVELEPTDHPLAVEQRVGITIERLRELTAYLG